MSTGCKGGSVGFTLIELVVTLAILALLSTIALPLAELTVQRGKEQELHAALRQIRSAIDAYKQAYDEGHIIQKVGESGYPPTLDILVQGVNDAQSQVDHKLYFLRRLPRDPFVRDSSIPAAETWGKRSYESSADDPQEGDDVYDVYAPEAGTGINGIPYREW
jgi:general secretion pathway protein G